MYGEKYGEYAYLTYILVLKICISFDVRVLTIYLRLQVS